MVRACVFIFAGGSCCLTVLCALPFRADAAAVQSEPAPVSALDEELERQKKEDGDGDSDDEFSVSSMSSDTHLSQYMSEDDDNMEPSDVRTISFRYSMFFSTWHRRTSSQYEGLTKPQALSQAGRGLRADRSDARQARPLSTIVLTRTHAQYMLALMIVC